MPWYAEQKGQHAVISPDYLMFFMENWWDADLYYCMLNTGTITYDLILKDKNLK